MIRPLIAWGPAAIWAAVLFLLSHVPAGATPDWSWMNDKVVHFGLYGILGVALAWGGKKSAWGGTLVLVGLGIGYGFLDEWHQGFIPGRDPSAGDLVADAVGVVLGVILGGLLFTRLGD